MQVQGQLSDNLRIVSGLTYLDATVRDNGDPAVAGNEIPAVPSFNFGLYTEYDLQIIPGLTLTSNVRAQDGFFIDIQNSDLRKADGFVQIDLGVRYTLPIHNRRVTLVANVFNVTDVNYWNGSTPFSELFVSNPRLTGVAITADFDDEQRVVELDGTAQRYPDLGEGL